MFAGAFGRSDGSNENIALLACFVSILQPAVLGNPWKTCKVEGELNNYIDFLLSNHTLLYSLSRFAACCIGKPIQNTENCKVEDELKNYIEYLFSKRTLLYSLSRFPINTNTSDCKVENPHFTVCPVFP